MTTQPASLETMAAFDRLVAVAAKHPLFFLIPKDWEPTARKALADGLTADQARTIRANLDTNAERARVKVILMQIVSFADAKTLLTWLLGDVERALKAADGHENAQGGTKTEGATDGTDGTDGTHGANASHGGAVLHSVKWRAFPMIELKYSGTEHWPNKGSTQAMIKVNGKKVEWLHPGQTVQSLKNILGEEYHQDIRSGQTVQLQIADVHGKNDSNALPLVWP